MKSQAQIAYDVERIKDKLDLVSKDVSRMKVVNNNGDEQMSYASVVKKSKDLPVIVKPKDNQQSAVTIVDIKSKITFKVVKVNGFLKMKDGGVAINCPSQAESIKIIEMAQNKVGEKYSVEIPVPFKPRMKILNVFDEMTDEEVVDNLKSQNTALENTDIVVKAVIKRNNRNNKTDVNGFDVIIEADQDACDTMLSMQSVNLGWSRCRIIEHIYVKRCFKCCGYGHLSADC